MSNLIYVFFLVFVYVFEILKLFRFVKQLNSLEERIKTLEDIYVGGDNNESNS